MTASANALKVYSRALDLIQNNVSNASTPGYAKQNLDLVSLPFDPTTGMGGGLTTGSLYSSRDEYSEQSVRRGATMLGYSQTLSQMLSAIETNLDVSGQKGLPAAMNQLNRAFSTWSTTPTDETARQGVLTSASTLAQAFRQTAAQLNDAALGANQKLQDTVNAINGLAVNLRDYNVEIRTGARNDAGLDAKIHATLEQLSALADTGVIQASDGSLTVMVGGRVPIVIGDQDFPIMLSFGQPADPPPTYPQGPQSARIYDAGGTDVTAAMTGGQLGGALEFRNGTLADLLGNASQPGKLNVLAKTMADRVNTILAGGVTDQGLPPAFNLFVYPSGDDTAVARTLDINPDLTTGELAAGDPGPPAVSNGTALKLEALAKPRSADDMSGGLSYMDYYGGMVADVGRQSAQAGQNAETATNTVSQARSLRNTLTGVSLDEEAVQLLQFQRAYQATAKVIQVLSDLSEVTIGILR